MDAEKRAEIEWGGIKDSVLLLASLLDQYFFLLAALAAL